MSGLPFFINKDPIEEDGGLNLYGFCGNDGVNDFDLLGMTDLTLTSPGGSGSFNPYTPTSGNSGPTVTLGGGSGSTGNGVPPLGSYNILSINGKPLYGPGGATLTNSNYNGGLFTVQSTAANGDTILTKYRFNPNSYKWEYSNTVTLPLTGTTVPTPGNTGTSTSNPTVPEGPTTPLTPTNDVPTVVTPTGPAPTIPNAFTPANNPQFSYNASNNLGPVNSGPDAWTYANWTVGTVGLVASRGDFLHTELYWRQLNGNWRAVTEATERDFLLKWDYAQSGKQLSRWKGVAKWTGVIGLGFSGVDIVQNGLNVQNGTDAAMGVVGFVPVYGWAVSGAYSATNMVYDFFTPALPPIKPRK